MPMTPIFRWALSLALCLVATAARGEGRNQVGYEIHEGRLFVRVTRDQDAAPVLAPSPLGVFVDGKVFITGRVEVDVEPVRREERIETPWGKFAAYDTTYEEFRVRCFEKGGDRELRIVCRVYDSAVALRYEFPTEGGWGDSVRLTGELTEFRFAPDDSAWAYNGEQEPIGPFSLGEPPSKELRMPLTIKLGANKRRAGGYAALLEAATFEQAPMTLVATDQGGYRVRFPESVIKSGHTSWRVILLGDTAGDLLTSPAPYCLNPPCDFDASWVKPGLAFWDWRAWGAKTKDGFTYGLDMASWRRFIDFASKNNVEYLLLDANWYGPEFEKASDPRTSRNHLVFQPDRRKPEIGRKPALDDWKDPIDVPAIIAYGKERGVGVILYINDVARLNHPFEETLALYEEWGAAGIKYGFMERVGQKKVLDTREIVRLCAKHHLLCNFHDGPIPPSGDERTFPNYVTREFCHAQADGMRSFTPTTFCKQVFVNMLAGPLDMNNGFFTLRNPAGDRPRVFQNIDSTVVSEVARVLVTYTGMAVLTDTPEAYAAKADLFDYLRRLPMDWDETRILSGEVGEHITTARRKGDTWYLGSVTNEAPRSLVLNLDFLQPGVTYKATLYEDADNAHFQRNREAYRVRKIDVTAEDVLGIWMAAGGGHGAIFEPAE